MDDIKEPISAPTHKTIRYLRIIFDLPLYFNQVNALRGAIVEKVGREHILFHQHLDADADKFLYRYPLIQYKSIRKKAAIVCLEDAVEEIHKLFSQPDWEIELKDETVALKIQELKVQQYNLQVWDRMFKYKILNWLPLNQKNITKYENLRTDAEKIEMLERLLSSQIISFAKGISWRVPKKFTVRISDVPEQFVRYNKNIPLAAFDVDFQTDISLPPFIGIGKSVSKGFGVVVRKRERKLSSGKNGK